MPSLRAQLVNRYLRLTMKKKPLHLIDAPELRSYFEVRRVPIQPGSVAVQPVDEAGVQGEWQRPAAGGAGRVVYYLHGGAYLFGSSRLYRSMTMPMAEFAAADLFSLNYRLAPEHPCPAAIEDALAGYDWLLGQGVAPEKIVFGGDSAGGGLALATLQVLRDRKRPAPAGAFLFSAWTDLAATGRSVTANADRDCMFQLDTIRLGGARYAGALGVKDPRVSPLYGDFRGLPPLLLFASRDEMLFDDSARVAENAKAAGVDVQFEAKRGLSHVWPLFYPLYPEAREALRRTAAFIRERTGISERIAA